MKRRHSCRTHNRSDLPGTPRYRWLETRIAVRALSIGSSLLPRQSFASVQRPKSQPWTAIASREATSSCTLLWIRDKLPRCRSRARPPQENASRRSPHSATPFERASLVLQARSRPMQQKTAERQAGLTRRLPQDLRENLIPALPAELRMKYGILHLQLAFDLKWQGVHVCISERVT